MELRHKLENIFHNDYPGTDRFLSEVIIPIFGDEIDYKDDDLALRPEYAEKAKNAGIKHIRYIGDLTEQNYSAQNIVLLDVTLDDSRNIERSRVNIQQLIRSIMDHQQHLMIVFHYEDTEGKQWRFSYAHKGDSLKDSTSAKRYTYVFGRGYRGRTAAERFEILARSERTDKDFEEAFSVAALSDEFFKKYRAYYAAFVQYITGEKYSDEKDLNAELKSFDWLQTDAGDQFRGVFDSDAKSARDYIKKMFGRIVFLYFLQRKGWLYDSNGESDPRYMHHLFEKAERDGLAGTFLDDVLELLFFYVLNTKKEQRLAEAAMNNKDIRILPGWQHIDYLNGGLFSQDEIDPKICVFPAVYFKKLFSFLDSYNFTIDENDQEDAEIGIDPEMLGRIFENLLEDNKDKGAYYTPKEIVEYMCREAIIAYLQDDRFKPEGNELIRRYVETQDVDLLNDKQREMIEEKLRAVKICDPAIGSGAFPMGVVNLLSKLFISLRTYTTIDQAKMKRYIMENNIYGVDIEQGAVDIARLRFWLAMVVDAKEAEPLPNLHFKIMQGNSLIESYQGVDLSDLTKVNAQSNLFDSTNSIREDLISSLKKYYNPIDHNERDRLFNDITNNVRNQFLKKGLIYSEKDPSANTDFFLWHTWFADVFEKGGFDIVIGNPPYVIVSKDDPCKALYDKIYTVAKGGKRNLYHLFFEKGIKILKKGGIISYITPDTFIAGNDTANLRKYFIENVKIHKVILYGEKDKVFKNVTQAVAVSLMTKSVPFSDFEVEVNGTNKLVRLSDVKDDSKNRFRWFNKAISKIKETKTKVDDFFVGYKGDINLGIKKKYFGLNRVPDSLPLVRGNQISPYTYFGSEECCQKEALSRDDTKKLRIVFQEISNAGLSRRIKATILMDVILGDTTNYILPKTKGISLYAALAIVNSKVINYYFKFYNQTNHVPIGDFKQIPFPVLSSNVQEKLEPIVKAILEKKAENTSADITDLEKEIDLVVYHLYGLGYEDVCIIDPETPFSREEYEGFSLD